MEQNKSDAVSQVQQHETKGTSLVFHDQSCKWNGVLLIHMRKWCKRADWSWKCGTGWHLHKTKDRRYTYCNKGFPSSSIIWYNLSIIAISSGTGNNPPSSQGWWCTRRLYFWYICRRCFTLNFCISLVVTKQKTSVTFCCTIFSKTDKHGSTKATLQKMDRLQVCTN